MNMKSDEEVLNTPEIIELTGNAEMNLLPEKSKRIYEQTYKKFMNYKLVKKIDSFAENVLMAYFVELSENMKSSTLWAIYSMLKTTINAYDNVDISKYLKLKAFLKKKADGYQAKKSRILRREQVEKFLLEAPDKKFLSRKVALIFGIAGACRSQELVQLKVSDIDEMKDKLLITLPDTKTKKKRFFLVTEHLDIYQKYVAVRPLMDSPRFFFKYTDGKPYKQLIGIHTFGKMPQEIATFLKLPNAEEYTGHCFRRTSTILFENLGGDIMPLKREGGGQSPTIFEDYDEDPLQIKSEISRDSFPSCSSSGTNCLPNSFSTSGQDDENSTDLENTVSFNKINGEGFVIKNCQNLTVNIINK